MILSSQEVRRSHIGAVPWELGVFGWESGGEDSTTGSYKKSGVEKMLTARARKSRLPATFQKEKKKPTKQEINLKSSNFSFLQIRASQNKPENRESYHFLLPSFSKLRNILIYHPLPERTSSPNKELSFKVGLIKKKLGNPYFPFCHRP